MLVEVESVLMEVFPVDEIERSQVDTFGVILAKPDEEFALKFVVELHVIAPTSRRPPLHPVTTRACIHR